MIWCRNLKLSGQSSSQLVCAATTEKVRLNSSLTNQLSAALYCCWSGYCVFSEKLLDLRLFPTLWFHLSAHENSVLLETILVVHLRDFLFAKDVPSERCMPPISLDFFPEQHSVLVFNNSSDGLHLFFLFFSELHCFFNDPNIKSYL